MKKKLFKSLEIARENNVDIVCFPELSADKEWIDTAKKYKDFIIIFGTYYTHGFNTCPIIINGQDPYIQKINPSPLHETEVFQDLKMKEGKKIFVFQTQCGVFIVLICIDYLKEVHHILFNPDEKIKNVDFIFVPAYNKDTIRFQKKGDTDCKEGNYPYIVQVNPWKINGKHVGGTCVIGTEHKDALQRYKQMGLTPDDSIEYKLIDSKKEKMIIIDPDIKRKGVFIQASGPKMKVVKTYTYKNGDWTAVQQF
jgi:hypothetical protein